MADQKKQLTELSNRAQHVFDDVQSSWLNLQWEYVKVRKTRGSARVFMWGFPLYLARTGADSVGQRVHTLRDELKTLFSHPISSIKNEALRLRSAAFDKPRNVIFALGGAAVCIANPVLGAIVLATAWKRTRNVIAMPFTALRQAVLRPKVVYAINARMVDAERGEQYSHPQLKDAAATLKLSPTQEVLYGRFPGASRAVIQRSFRAFENAMNQLPPVLRELDSALRAGSLSFLGVSDIWVKDEPCPDLRSLSNSLGDAVGDMDIARAGLLVRNLMELKAAWDLKAGVVEPDSGRVVDTGPLGISDALQVHSLDVVSWADLNGRQSQARIFVVNPATAPREPAEVFRLDGVTQLQDGRLVPRGEWALAYGKYLILNTQRPAPSMEELADVSTAGAVATLPSPADRRFGYQIVDAMDELLRVGANMTEADIVYLEDVVKHELNAGRPLKQFLEHSRYQLDAPNTGLADEVEQFLNYRKGPDSGAPPMGLDF